MNLRLIFKTALLAGEIMLRNGAETYRVEDTINRILKTTNLEVIESFVTPTGIFATLDGPNIESITMVRRVASRTIHMEKIEQVNTVSRNYVDGKITIEDAYGQLKLISQLPSYPYNLRIVSYSIVSACFTIVFGGTFRDFITSAVIGLILGIFHLKMDKHNISKYITDILSSAMVAILAIIFTKHIPIGYDMNVIIIGCIMPLVPGLAITNAIRDTLEGDLVSGLSRGAEAFIIAVSIAVGVGISLNIFL